jgi:hypothetical protein
MPVASYAWQTAHSSSSQLPASHSTQSFGTPDSIGTHAHASSEGCATALVAHRHSLTARSGNWKKAFCYLTVTERKAFCYLTVTERKAFCYLTVTLGKAVLLNSNWKKGGLLLNSNWRKDCYSGENELSENKLMTKTTCLVLEEWTQES